MKSIGKIIVGAAALWATVAIGGAWSATTDTPIANTDSKRINTCMAMSADALAQDADCADLMKRQNISVADMQTMKTCKSMKDDMMAKDETCGAMARKYPDMMRPTPQ